MGKHRYRVQRTPEAEARREEAARVGLTRYEGDPCPIEGHGVMRYVRKGNCCDCSREATESSARRRGVKKRVDKHPEFAHLKGKERQKAIEKKNKRWLTPEVRKRRAQRDDRRREAVRAYKRRWAEKNTPYITAKSKLRKEAKRNRTPPWLTAEHKRQIRAFYEEAWWQGAVTGKQHHVDHIQPLQGKRSSGLHVPWNLCVMPGRLNESKGNAESGRIEDAVGRWRELKGADLIAEWDWWLMSTY